MVKVEMGGSERQRRERERQGDRERQDTQNRLKNRDTDPSKCGQERERHGMRG